MRALPFPGLRCLVLVALAATARGELAQDPPQPAGAEKPAAQQSYAGRTTFSLLQEMLQKRDAVDVAIFEELGRRRDREALDALIEAIEGLYQKNTLDAACAALAHFAGEEELEKRAISFLAGIAEDIRMPRTQPATRGLVLFGSRALQPLRDIVAKHLDPVCRRIAVGGLLPMLRAQRTSAALHTLLDWYRAPDSGPREDLVRVLSEFDEPALLEILRDTVESGKADEQIRSMALEAIGRMKNDAVLEILLDALDTSAPSVQLAAIDALRKRGHKDHAHELERLVHDKDAAVRKAAFVALGEIVVPDAAWRRQVLEAATGRDYALRSAATKLLAALGDEEAVAALGGLLADPYHGVRVEAIDALASVRRREVVPLLIARLEVESLRLAQRVHHALVLLTGLENGLSPVPWRAWWEAEGASFQLPTLDAALAAERTRDEHRATYKTQARFYGIQIVSDRLCFVLDTSGSMAELVTEEDMRIDLVKRELLASIASLPDGARFNMVFFSDRAREWQKKLVEVDERSREDASEFVAREGAGGATALWDALEKAFEDPDLDTIVLFSDGEPTKGRIVDASEILEAVRTRDSLRHVVIHTVSMQGGGDLMRGLAEATGGEYREASTGKAGK
jgi:HEAT repeat protein/Mg-chelatase subunit ChlD